MHPNHIKHLHITLGNLDLIQPVKILDRAFSRTLRPTLAPEQLTTHKQCVWIGSQYALNQGLVLPAVRIGGLRH
jgi:hypothetical protein